MGAMSMQSSQPITQSPEGWLSIRFLAGFLRRGKLEARQILESGQISIRMVRRARLFNCQSAEEFIQPEVVVEGEITWRIVANAASYAGVQKITVYKWIEEGRIHWKKISGRTFVDLSTLINKKECKKRKKSDYYLREERWLSQDDLQKLGYSKNVIRSLKDQGVCTAQHNGRLWYCPHSIKHYENRYRPQLVIASEAASLLGLTRQSVYQTPDSAIKIGKRTFTCLALHKMLRK